jgi:hypothetical protein
MAIKTIPLSRLEVDLKKTLDECADSGETVVIEPSRVGTAHHDTSNAHLHQRIPYLTTISGGGEPAPGEDVFLTGSMGQLYRLLPGSTTIQL